MKKVIMFSMALLVSGAISATAADAKAVWDKDCAKCHGANGKGQTTMGKKLGVRDYTEAKVQAELKDDAMAKAIKEGFKKDDKTLMKAFPDLSDAEVKSLVAYIRSLKK